MAWDRADYLGSRQYTRSDPIGLGQTLAGKRASFGESYVGALGDMAMSAVEGVQNLGADVWDRALTNVASMMGIRGNEAGPARSSFFQRVDRIGWPGAVVVTGLQASVFGPYESLGTMGSAGVDTGYGLATGNAAMAGRGAAQLTVMAAGVAAGPVISRVRGLVGNTESAALSAGGKVVIGPWREGATNIVENGVFTQCADGSCVSATGQILSGGTLTEQQLLGRRKSWTGWGRVAGARRAGSHGYLGAHRGCDGHVSGLRHGRGSDL